MKNNEFSEASTELVEILDYLPKNLVDKVPSKLKELFYENADKNYITQIDPNKPLDEQNIKEKTKDLITVLYRKYWCNEEERKQLDKRLIENEKKYEEYIRKTYSVENLFKKDKIENDKDISLVEIKEKSFIQKILEKFKSIFRRKNGKSNNKQRK